MGGVDARRDIGLQPLAPDRAVIVRAHPGREGAGRALHAAVVPAGISVEVEARRAGEAAADRAVEDEALVGDAVEDEGWARRGEIAAVGGGGGRGGAPPGARARGDRSW